MPTASTPMGISLVPVTRDAPAMDSTVQVS